MTHPVPAYRETPPRVRWHFFDSGAFSMWGWSKEWQRRTGSKTRWGYYDTKAHWRFVDEYCRFVWRNRKAIDYFANVDVIGSPELTYRNQRYIERVWGLEPVPVVHCRSDQRWVRRYVEEGYTYIGFGLAGASTGQARDWMDDAFRYVCDTPDRTPRVRVHGFAVTRFSLFTRYCWYSVDSASWTKVGAYGGILVPQYRGGRFVFTRPPYVLKVADQSPDIGKPLAHFACLPPLQKDLIRRWLDECKLPLGSETERGVVNDHCVRKDVCVQFFEGMTGAVKPYPWSWTPPKLQGLGL